jgi:photosystem II stability/assembly factor-like uncharacterized protein
MTDNDLERELRDHYRAIDAGPSGRATTRVADALGHAAARRWSLGRFVGARSVRLAGAALAAAAVVAVALLPAWQGSVVGPAASPTASSWTPTTGPVITPTPTASQLPVSVESLDGAGMARNGVLWAVYGRALSISADHGHTWQTRSLPTPGTTWPTMTAVDADHAWLMTAGTTSSSFTVVFTVFRTSDGGATWKSAKLPGTYDGTALQQITFVDANVGFVIITPDSPVPPDSLVTPDPLAQAERRIVLRTTDGGATWVVTGTAASSLDTLVAVDANTLWLAASSSLDLGGNRPLLQVSRNAGATWTRVSLPGISNTSSAGNYVLTNMSRGVTFLSPSEGYVATIEDTVTAKVTRYFRTTDGGRTWKQVASVGHLVQDAPVFLDATHWYQAGYPENSLDLLTYQAVASTADGGKTWTVQSEVALAARGAIYVLCMADAQNGAGIGRVEPWPGQGGDGLFLTWDGGKTWQPADFSVH